MGDGRYPQTILNVAVALWGVLVAFGAASRAQSAPTRRDYMAEVLPCLAGFAIVFAAVGSTLGLVAALVILVSESLLVTSMPLADRPGPSSLLVTAAGTGMPAGLAFGGLLLGLEAAFEAGGALGLIGLAGVATWLLAAAAAARSVRLPPAAETGNAEARPGIAAALAGVALAAGPALGVIFAAGYAAANEVLPSTAQAPGLESVATASTVLPAVTLLGPLLVV